MVEELSIKSKGFIFQDSLVSIFIVMISVHIVVVTYLNVVSFQNQKDTLTQIIQDEITYSLNKVERNCDIVCPKEDENEDLLSNN